MTMTPLRVMLPGSIKNDLEVRYRMAVDAWNPALKKFRNAPFDPSKSIASAGGFFLSQAEYGDLMSRYPNVARLWASTFYKSLGWSHGGFYYAADPDLYESAPSWVERRKFAETRLLENFKLLPSDVDLNEMLYASWIGLVGLLELIRTDLAAIGWNELWLENVVKHKGGGLRNICAFLDWVSQLMAQLMPAVLVKEACQRQINMDPPSFDIPRIAGLYESFPHDASRYAVRSRREGDSLFGLWAAARRLLLSGDLPEESTHIHIYGNAFGAFDLAPMLAATLKINTNHRVSWSICRYSSHHEAQTSSAGAETSIICQASGINEIKTFQGANKTIVIFCDDSVFSGRSYHEFLCDIESQVDCKVIPFFLTVDVNSISSFSDEKLLENAYRLSPYAVSSSLWAEEGVDLGADVAECYVKKMQRSRDLQLRATALWQPEIVNYLNCNSVSTNRFTSNYGCVPGSISFIPPYLRGQDRDGVVHLDASNAPNNPYTFLSPFTYSDDWRIPVPGTNLFSNSVEGVWQGCKVIDGLVDHRCFAGPPTKRPSSEDRKSRSYLYSEQRFLYGEELIDIVRARDVIYRPAYKSYFEHYIPISFKHEMAELFVMGLDIRIHDVDANGDMSNADSAYAHASYLCELLNEWFLMHS